MKVIAFYYYELIVFYKKINGNNKRCTYYLNELLFTDNVNDSDYKKLRCVKRMLVIELEDYNVSKLIHVLSIVDNLFITLTVGGLQDILTKTDTLREKFLSLISFEHFVDTNNKQEDS